MAKVTVLPAKTTDASVLLNLIKELALYEKRLEDVLINEGELADALSREAVHALILYEDDCPAGVVIFCYTYSTWDGEVVQMEDLYVRETHRRKGYGMVLWKELAKVRNLLWNVLDWNESAISFYKTMPCENRTEKEGWKWFRLDREGIKQLAAKERS